MHSLIKPPKLAQGDTIGIIAPSMPVLPSLQDKYQAGKAALRDLGFQLKEGQTIHLQRWWAAGTPRQQADDIHAMFTDPQVKAVMAHTGGNSAISVLEHLDFNLIADHPKPFIGMSDITVYHVAFLTTCGLIGFHMDDVTFGLGSHADKLAFQKQMFIQFLTRTIPPGQIQPLTTWACWRSGQAKGRLIGGNLHLLSKQIGTPYFPSLDFFNGAILFWEDVGESLYNLARSLYHLKYLGIFDRISGMAIGKITKTPEPDDPDITEPSLSELVLDILQNYNFPVLADMDFGHYTVNIPMILGLEVELDVDNKKLTYLESAVV